MRAKRRDNVEIYATILDCARKEIHVSTLILKARLCPSHVYYFIDQLVLRQMLIEKVYINHRRYHSHTFTISEKGLVFLKLWRTLLQAWNTNFTPLDVLLFPSRRLAPMLAE